MPFNPHFTITSAVAQALIRIEAARQSIRHLPITPSVLATLRETARLDSTHYSTMIEGNRLTQEQVVQVVEQLFTISQRTARLLLKQWADSGFILVADPAKKKPEVRPGGTVSAQHLGKVTCGRADTLEDCDWRQTDCMRLS